MVKHTFYKCVNCFEINEYIGDDIRYGCECDPMFLVPSKVNKR